VQLLTKLRFPRVLSCWPGPAPSSSISWTFPHIAGGEVRKDRPAVIVSNNAANQHSNRVQVVPVSSRLDKLYPCEARVAIDGRPSKAMADQIMTVSKVRLSRRLSTLSPDEIAAVDFAIRVQLALTP
jgi:mRNA interferase MazF